ncbi:hypothetical protein BaRGS_00021837 [Batillaria attramentaria]|uniref:Uncharacterized protein n=1 Tax=Batillaria attramentaria TaxID=370345 RepID=A0ABD0KI23_9CAEN
MASQNYPSWTQKRLNLFSGHQNRTRLEDNRLNTPWDLLNLAESKSHTSQDVISNLPFNRFAKELRVLQTDLSSGQNPGDMKLISWILTFPVDTDFSRGPTTSANTTVHQLGPRENVLLYLLLVYGTSPCPSHISTKRSANISTK